MPYIELSIDIVVLDDLRYGFPKPPSRVDLVQVLNEPVVILVQEVEWVFAEVFLDL